MRVQVGLLAAACIVIAGCRAPSAALQSASPSPNVLQAQATLNCPDGKTAQPGLENFGAYIGTWQAGHRSDPDQLSHYSLPTVPGYIAVGCSPRGYIVVEVMRMSFYVPAGRALQFALTELPGDSERIYDRTYTGCRKLMYRSQRLEQQLGKDDGDGSADITFQSAGGYNSVAISFVRIQVPGTLRDGSPTCPNA